MGEEGQNTNSTQVREKSTCQSDILEVWIFIAEKTKEN